MFQLSRSVLVADSNCAVVGHRRELFLAFVSNEQNVHATDPTALSPHQYFVFVGERKKIQKIYTSKKINTQWVNVSFEL